MEDTKKKIFIAYLDDDDKRKGVWVDYVEELETTVSFEYNNEKITLPYHRILKIKRKVGTR